ncbi:MAG: DUF1134 domain-containing protein [Chloroflexota bacterium]
MKMRRILVGSLIIGTFLFGFTFAHAAEQSDGMVRLTGKSVGAIVGFSWGSGILTYKGKEYPFTISGISAGDVGYTSAELTGEVFGLKNVEDFNGTYATLGAGITLAGGGEAVTMKNQNGVVLNLTGATQGLNFKLGVDGVKIELTR